MEQEKLMTAEESYVERRQLFKDIWETAMNMDEKDGEILNKPKVIKTLRLSDVDRSAGRKKKQRLRNLRAVCKKILEFCDKQDADDIFYEQVVAEGHVAPLLKPETTKRHKLKRKKVKRSKSLFTTPKAPADPRTTVSDGKDNFAVDSKNKPSRNTSASKRNRPVIMKKPYILPKMGSTVPSASPYIKPIKQILTVKPSNNVSSRKMVKKRSNPKKKKVSRDHTMPLKINVIE